MLLSLLIASSKAYSVESVEAENMHLLERDAYGRLMVGVHVNGSGPFPFILDTGASRSVIYRSLTALMPLEALPNQSRRIITASGYRSVQVFPVKDLYVLGHTLHVEDTVLLPDIIGSDAKGLIGVDVLAGRTLLMQPYEDLAAILDTAEILNMEDWHQIQGRPVAYGSLALEVEIGGVTVPLIVDTGASNTVINSAGAEALGRAGFKAEKASVVIAGVRSSEKLQIPKLELGDYSVGQASFYVADVPVFRLLGARQVPAMILGMDVLGQQDFAIDFKKWRLHLKQSQLDDGE